MWIFKFLPLPTTTRSILFVHFIQPTNDTLFNWPMIKLQKKDCLIFAICNVAVIVLSSGTTAAVPAAPEGRTIAAAVVAKMSRARVATRAATRETAAPAVTNSSARATADADPHVHGPRPTDSRSLIPTTR